MTLIEVLVVVSIISLLMAILIPSLQSSKSQGKEIVCKYNLRQLALANEGYSQEYCGYSVPGASDIYSENLHRWYGERPCKNAPFDPTKGPLASYLSGLVIQCPQKIAYTILSPDKDDYEQGNGGYGYNFTYIGSQIWQIGYENHGCKESARLSGLRRPQETLLFSDTAMAKQIDGSACLIMYPFAEPRFFVINRKPEPAWAPSPSIHFRHRKYADIVWADGHVDGRKMGEYDEKNNDGTEASAFHIGWFEPMDNSLFDLE
jgi:prepilin-type processing-associated H-X9-DG protein